MERKCPKCSGILIKCVATSSMGKFCAVKLPIKHFTTKESSELNPFVCLYCGYTEWYVEKPENFRDSDKGML